MPNVLQYVKCGSLPVFSKPGVGHSIRWQLVYLQFFQVSLGGKHAGSERQLQCQCWNSFKCFLTLNELGLDVTKVGGMASDGASVMLGCNNGEAAKLKAIVPSVMVVHCICHSNRELSYIESHNLSDWTVEAFWVFKREDGTRVCVCTCV